MKLMYALFSLSICLLLTQTANAVTRMYTPGEIPKPSVTAPAGIMQSTGKVRSIDLQTHRMHIDAIEYAFDPLNTRFSNAAGVGLMPTRVQIGDEVSFSAKPAATSGSPPMLQAVRTIAKP